MTKGHCGLGVLNMTKQNKPNQTKLPSLIGGGCQYYTISPYQTHTLQTQILHGFSLFSPFIVASKLYRVLDIELRTRLQLYLSLDPCGVVFISMGPC